MATIRYIHTMTSTTNTLGNVTYVNFSEPQYLRLDQTCYDSDGSSTYRTFTYSNTLPTNLLGQKMSANANYFNAMGSGGGQSWPNFYGGKTVTIPAGSFIFLPTDSSYVEYEWSDGTVSSGEEYYHYGSDELWIIPSAGRAYSTVKSELDRMVIGSHFSSIDEYDNVEYSDVYASIDNLVYYCKTDVVFYGYEEQDYETGDTSGYIEYRSGTLQYVTGTVTTRTNVYYTVNTTGGYVGGYTLTGTYYLEPSSVSLNTTTPQAGKSATIAVSRTSTTGSNASTYGYPITYTYQYSTNGGTSWTTIASSTATSYSFTIPSGASTIMVRVQAKDSLGTGGYVTSTSYAVQQSKTYVGVSNVARIATVIICHAGGVRNATSYACKDGVIKQT